MKKTILLSFVIVTAFFLASCKKKTYPDSTIEGTPVFYFKGTVNSAPVELHGGINNYYMYSSWAQDVNGVYNLIGNLRSNSGGTENSIQIQINDQRVSATNIGCNIDSALYSGYYPFKTATGGCLYYSLQFYPFLKNGYYPTYTWNFGDGSAVSTQTNPVHFFKRFQNYNISLTANTFSYGASSISNWFNTKPGSFNAGITPIGNDTGKTATLTFKNMSTSAPYLGGKTPYNFFWDFGCGGSCTSTSITAMNTYAQHGAYPVSLRVIDSNNDSIVANYNFATQYSQACAVNYSYSVTPYPNQKDFSNIIINWTDASGKLYSSNNSAQPGDSYFQILSVEDYANNELGQTTKKVHVKFKCTVYPIGTSSNSPVTIDNGEAVIAVAYK